MIINNDQAGLLELAAKGQDGITFNPKRDGHRVIPGTHVLIKGKPATIVLDDGVFFEWVEGHVEVNGGNNRSIITLI